MASISPPPPEHHQEWAVEGMDLPPPQHHYQQQQAHAGPDQEVMEVKQLLEQTLGSAGILNHVKVRLSQLLPPFPSKLPSFGTKSLTIGHPSFPNPNRLCSSQGSIWPLMAFATGNDLRPVLRTCGCCTPIKRWPRPKQKKEDSH
jgi:hypothetical protein